MAECDVIIQRLMTKSMNTEQGKYMKEIGKKSMRKNK